MLPLNGQLLLYPYLGVVDKGEDVLKLPGPSSLAERTREERQPGFRVFPYFTYLASPLPPLWGGGVFI